MDDDVLELIKNVLIANLPIIKFVCAGVPNKCEYCKNQFVGFVTSNVWEALNHGKENNVAMWISD